MPADPPSSHSPDRSDRRAALLRKRLKGSNQTPFKPQIPVHPDLRQARLSFSQKRFWMGHEFLGRSIYNRPSVMRLMGKLDVGALQV